MRAAWVSLLLSQSSGSVGKLVRRLPRRYGSVRRGLPRVVAFSNYLLYDCRLLSSLPWETTLSRIRKPTGKLTGEPAQSHRSRPAHLSATCGGKPSFQAINLASWQSRKASAGHTQVRILPAQPEAPGSCLPQVDHQLPLGLHRRPKWLCRARSWRYPCSHRR